MVLLWWRGGLIPYSATSFLQKQYCTLIDVPMVNVQINILQFPKFKPLKGHTLLLTELNHLHFLCIPNAKKNYTQIAFPKKKKKNKKLPRGRHILMDAFLHTSILAFSGHGSIIIYPPNPHFLFLLFCCHIMLSFILTVTFYLD